MNFDIALADNNKTLPLINRNDSLLTGLVIISLMCKREVPKILGRMSVEREYL